MIECKGGFFDRGTKYGGDPGKLRQTIDEKLVRTAEGKKKGIEQLASSINSLFSCDSDEVPRDIDLSAVRCVYPVLIVREPLVDAPGVNRLLNREFNKLIVRRSLKVKVESLFCLSASTLEGIAPYLRGLRFTDVLDARKAEDKNLFLPFYVAPNEVLDNAAIPGSNCIARTFRNILNGVAKQLFPAEAASLSITDHLDEIVGEIV